MSGILRIEVWEIHSPCSARLREWDGCLPQASLRSTCGYPSHGLLRRPVERPCFTGKDSFTSM